MDTILMMLNLDKTSLYAMKKKYYKNIKIKLHKTKLDNCPNYRYVIDFLYFGKK